MAGKTKDLKVVAKVPKKKKTSATLLATGELVKHEVKKQLAKAVENKYVTRFGVANISPGTTYPTDFVTPGIIDNTFFRTLLPPVSEGTDGNQRVGKSITPKYMKVKVHVAFANDIEQSAIRDLRFMFVTNKSVKDTTMLTSNSAGIPNYADELLWDGKNASPTSYQGCEPYYNQMPINRKQWNVIEDKIVRIAKTVSGSSPTPSADAVQAITSQYSHDFEVTIPLPSKFLYDGGPTVDYPSNFAPILAVGWVDAMYTTAVGSVDNNKDVLIEWTSSLSYEDA